MPFKRLPNGFVTGLSARLLLLTVFFVMLCELLIFLPSVARDRLAYLEDRLDAARLAVFALDATPDNMVTQSLANELLADVGAHGIVVHKPDSTLMIDSEMPPVPDATFDLRGAGMFSLIRDALGMLMRGDNRILRVLDASAKEPGVVVEVLLDEAPLRAEMWDFAERLFGVSLVISLVTAALVYVSLQWLLVAPMRRLTQGMIQFREHPENASLSLAPPRRRDEVGQAEREFAAMQETVRQAMSQKERLGRAWRGGHQDQSRSPERALDHAPLVRQHRRERRARGAARGAEARRRDRPRRRALHRHARLHPRGRGPAAALALRA